ncbi:MAG: flavin reductase family protein [Hyphomicrobiales bacterium]|jgi:flavin reductase (DIM6/NTAB) family NADH-FMN oxidoreductase RutF|nr:flavin reductase family protein [Hyphomicrobiales bacterium]|tara:strand:+ start:882 stop:1346 length:465 start_codon:yes stop_codon:yes gene_type:complete
MDNKNDLRNALGCYATGVTIITTSDQHLKPVGLTINSFTSLSLDPPLIMWGISKNTPSIEAFKYRKLFAVNILTNEQSELLKIFSTPSIDKFKEVPWEMNDKKLPIIKDCVANFECTTHSVFPGGDHDIFVGKVIEYYYNNKKPLILSRGSLIS